MGKPYRRDDIVRAMLEHGTAYAVPLTEAS